MASLIGTTVEWYDFFLYGTVAALVFNRLYFPTFDPLAGTLAAFGTYTVGFVAATVVSIAERLKLQTIATTDRGHFSQIQPSDVERFTLAPLVTHVP